MRQLYGRAFIKTRTCLQMGCETGQNAQSESFLKWDHAILYN